MGGRARCVLARAGVRGHTGTRDASSSKKRRAGTKFSFFSEEPKRIRYEFQGSQTVADGRERRRRLWKIMTRPPAKITLPELSSRWSRWESTRCRMFSLIGVCFDMSRSNRSSRTIFQSAPSVSRHFPFRAPPLAPSFSRLFETASNDISGLREGAGGHTLERARWWTAWLEYAGDHP